MALIQPRLNYKLSVSDYCAFFKAFFRRSDGKPANLIKIFGSDKIYMFDNARSGLQLALSLLPQGAGVGIQPLTCPTVLEAIEKAGCRVVFVDINDQFVIDVDLLKYKIDQIDALIETHTFGFPAEMNQIRSVIGNKMLIEDCAHAFLSKNSKGRIVGLDGDISIFSYGFGKFPSAIQGGYFLVNNSKYDAEIKKLYQEVSRVSRKAMLVNFVKALLFPLLNTPIFYTYVLFRLKIKRKAKFSYSKPATNKPFFKSFPANQALLMRQLVDIDKKLSVQKSNGDEILNALHSNALFSVAQKDSGQNFFMIPVTTEDPEGFIAHAQARGIEVGRHFVQSKDIIPHFGYKKGDCRNYERLVDRLITFPSHYAYPKKRLKQIILAINSYKTK